MANCCFSFVSAEGIELEAFLAASESRAEILPAPACRGSAVEGPVLAFNLKLIGADFIATTAYDLDVDW